MVRSGVHQALDLVDGCEQGTVATMVVLSAEMAEVNHWSSWFRGEVSGGGGMTQSLSLSVRPGQSASCQGGLGLSL